MNVKISYQFSEKDPLHEDTIIRLGKAAKQGDALAQNILGHCYWCFGNSKEEAVKWYRKAAEQGVAEAQCNLGLCYLDGNGVAQNKVKGVMWLRKAAEQGNAEAKEMLKKMTE